MPEAAAEGALNAAQKVRVNNRAEKARCAIDDADDRLREVVRVFTGPFNEDTLIAHDLFEDARALLRAARFLISEAREKVDPTIVAPR